MATDAMSTVEPGGPYGQIILFGDSITENAYDVESGFSYAAALSHVYKRRLDVVNRGFSGYNTQHALSVLPKFMPKPEQCKVELLIICFGANDSCLPQDPTGHHVPVDIYRDNLIAMVNSPEVKAHAPRILLLTPPPIDEYQRIVADGAKGYLLRRTAENTFKYALAAEAAASVLEVPLVDIWTSFLLHAGWVQGYTIAGSQMIAPNEVLQGLFTDGLHMSSAGYRLMFETVLDSIKVHHPSLDPDKMEYIYPVWEKAPKAGC